MANQFGTVGAPPVGGSSNFSQPAPTMLYQLPNGQLITQQQYNQMMQNAQWNTQPSNTNQSQAQFPPSLQPSSTPLNGRFISSPDDILPREISMDGGVSLFPMSDYTCIYAKQWDANGNIQTVKYVPVIENGDQNEIPNITGIDTVLEHLGSIEQKLEKIEKQRPYYYNKKKPYNNQSKQKEG